MSVPQNLPSWDSVMLEAALIASPIDSKVTTLKRTQNPLGVMRKPSGEICYGQQLFTTA